MRKTYFLVSALMQLPLHFGGRKEIQSHFVLKYNLKSLNWNISFFLTLYFFFSTCEREIFYVLLHYIHFTAIITSYSAGYHHYMKYDPF